MEPLLNNWVEHVVIFAVGGLVMGVVAHAVNTFPTPKNQYGAWLLGTVQFAVGQRAVAKNTVQGMQTVAVAVPNGK